MPENRERTYTVEVPVRPERPFDIWEGAVYFEVDGQRFAVKGEDMNWRLLMWHPVYAVRDWYRRATETFWMFVAWHTPRVLVKWCAIRLFCHATQGCHAHHIVPELNAIDALQRWDVDNKE